MNRHEENFCFESAKVGSLDFSTNVENFDAPVVSELRVTQFPTAIMDALVIAPHPDDECIGCGGTICRHVERGDRVTVVFLTSGELGLAQLSPEEAWHIREAEAQCAAKILGISKLHFLRSRDWFLGDEIDVAAEKLLPILQTVAPEMIYLPHENEWHPDHKASLPIIRAALTQIKNFSPQVRTYEVWTPMMEFDHVENVSDCMEKKLTALRAHKSQVQDWDYPRAVRGLNEYRGVMAGRCQFAEVFATPRFVSVRG